MNFVADFIRLRRSTEEVKKSVANDAGAINGRGRNIAGSGKLSPTLIFQVKDVDDVVGL